MCEWCDEYDRLATAYKELAAAHDRLMQVTESVIEQRDRLAEDCTRFHKYAAQIDQRVARLKHERRELEEKMDTLLRCLHWVGSTLKPGHPFRCQINRALEKFGETLHVP